MSEPGDSAQTRIEWLELFFDLVVVAAVAVLTEGLREDPTGAGLGLFVLLYAGIWFSWVTVVLYANVARDRTRSGTVIVSMFLVAVMAASAPIHFSDRANAFAVGFIALRLLVARSAQRTGRLLFGWPLLQFGGATVLWVAAMWVPESAKYILWAAALGLDVVFVLVKGDRIDEREMQRLRTRIAGAEAQAARRSQRRERGADPPEAAEPGGGPSDGASSPAGHVEVTAVDIEAEHLSERLGVFVIIVLGEAVSQLVLVGATEVWTRALVGIAVAGFALLVGLWGLTFSYGFVGGPHTRMATLQPRFGLPLHFLTTIGVIALAAGMGEQASHPHEPLTTLLRWVMCVGLALYYLVMGVVGWSAGSPLRWVLGWALPCTLAPLAVALAGEHVSGSRTLWLFVATTVWMNLYGRSLGRAGPPVVTSQ